MTKLDIIQAVDDFASNVSLSESERYHGLQDAIDHAEWRQRIQNMPPQPTKHDNFSAGSESPHNDFELPRIFGGLYCGMMGTIFLLSLLQLFIQHYSLRVLAPFAQGEWYTTSDLDRFWYSYSPQVAIVSAVLLALYGISAATNIFQKWQRYSQQISNFLLRKSRS